VARPPDRFVRRVPAENIEGLLPPRKQHKTLLRRRQFDHFELDSVLFGCSGGVFASVTLIDEGDLNCPAGLGLNSLGEFGDLSAILFIGRSYA
jgi:hypothetical protein